MGKFISLGQYNHLYKYIWIYLSIRFITLFIFSEKLVFVQNHTDILEMPYGPFISLQLEYVGFFIISLVIKLIKIFLGKKDSDENINDKKLIFNEIKKEIFFYI